MNQILNRTILGIMMLLSACSYLEETRLNPFMPTKKVYGNEQPYIILQQPQSRILATCYDTESVSSEACAKTFEAKGFVRIKDLPYRTANYDFLQTDTYPTRRWRDGQKAPRW